MRNLEFTEEKIASFYKPLKLRFALLFGIISLLLGYIVFVAITLNRQVTEEIVSRSQREQLVSASQQSARLVEMFNYIEADLIVTANRPEVQEFNEKKIRLLLLEFYNRHSNFVVSGYLMDGTILRFVEGRDRSGEGQDISYQAHIKKLFRTKRPVVSGSFMAVEGYYSVAIHVPILIDREVKGSIATLVRWDAFGPWFRKAKVSPDSSAMLLDWTGTIIYCVKPEYVGKKLDELPAIIFDGKLLSSNYFLKNNTAVVEIPFFKEKKYVIACSPFSVGSERYSLVSYVPYVDIAGPLMQFSRLFGALVGAASLIVISAFAYILYLFRQNRQQLISFEKGLREEIIGHRKADEALRKSKEELEKKNDELKKFDELKSDFISNVSHELRSPLTVIKEVVSQVLDGILGEITEEQRRFLSMALLNIDRLTRIISDLLDVSRLEARKVKLRRELIDITELAKGVSSSFISQAGDRGLKIGVSFSKKTIEVYADKDKIIQVFTNLVDNAIKFSEEGCIEISVVDKEEHVECSVSDTGRGIAEKALPKIFDKFEQFGQTVRSRGAGIGLSIAKAMVELHHGKIWVESKLNRGTKFTFTLPKYTREELISGCVTDGLKEAAGRKSLL